MKFIGWYKDLKIWGKVIAKIYQNQVIKHSYYNYMVNIDSDLFDTAVDISIDHLGFLPITVLDCKPSLR